MTDVDLAELERRREYALEQWRDGDSDLVYDFVRDDVLTLLARVRATEARIAALEVAARAVVDAASWQSGGVVIDCGCPRGEIGTLSAGEITHHTEACPVSVLAALLTEAGR
jgi:hypothetical protein